jgi:hypothetical protein
VLYLTYSQIPELKSVPRDQWRTVLVSAGKAYGKTPLFWKIWWLTIFLTFGLGLGVSFAISMVGGEYTTALWAFTVTGLLGYTLAFSIRTSCLRPHIRQYLASRVGA